MKIFIIKVLMIASNASWRIKKIIQAIEEYRECLVYIILLYVMPSYYTLYVITTVFVSMYVSTGKRKLRDKWSRVLMAAAPPRRAKAQWPRPESSLTFSLNRLWFALPDDTPVTSLARVTHNYNWCLAVCISSVCWCCCIIYI